MAGTDLTFPLVPRRRLVGLAFGGVRSARRGLGDDVAGSRTYNPGDDVDLIDWAASARLSSARGTDEFVVRQTFADEAPRIVVFCDRRPQMSYFTPPFPWLDKASAMRNACELVCDSAAAARGFVGYLDFAGGEPFWQAPKSERSLWEVKEQHLQWSEFSAPPDTLQLGLDQLAEHRVALPPGTFVFVVSDFLGPDADAGFERALGFRWDVVPVVVQDPIWEQSFPDVGGLVVPFAAVGGTPRLVRLTTAEARERRERNEARLAELLEGFGSRDLEPVLVSTDDPGEILESFLEWSDARLYHRGRLW
jgi:uncharacterized protein (DUF58 family)